MLKWLKVPMTGREDTAPAAPAQSTSTGTAAEPATPPNYLRREPLLNREHQVCGYELNLERPQPQRVRHPAAQRFLDGALLDRLGGAQFAGVLGRRMGFLPLHPVSLDLPQLDQLAVVASSAGSSLVISLQGDAAGKEPAAILGGQVPDDCAD